MNINFFGLQGSFDFNQIGGTDSYFRRIGLSLVKAGYNISFVHYGCDHDLVEQPIPGITVHRFCAFEDALGYLASQKGTVLVNAVNKKDRLSFIRFRYQMKHNIRFYFVASGYPEMFVSRQLRFMEAALYPYNGGAFCMSPRLVGTLRHLRNRAILLLPPVPEHYYIDSKDKSDNGRLVVTYMGRTISGKGVDEAFEVFCRLQEDPTIDTNIHGYIWPVGHGHEDYSIHKQLINQSRIKYCYGQYKGWSPAVDEKVADILRKTDILLLPYRHLNSTIDMPLMLLEGMAAGCCVITRPLGDMPIVYGNSPFVLSGQNFVTHAIELIQHVKNNPRILDKERERIQKRTQELKFNQEAATEIFLGALK